MPAQTESGAWSAVVVNYNAGSLLADCVRSLVDDGAASVVVVDNASSDDSLATVEASGLPVQVLRLDSNRGYASAANAGIATTGTDVVAVLNPDAQVRAGTGAAMTGALSAPGVAAAGPRLVNVDGTTYPSARSVPRTTDAVGHGVFGLFWPSNPFTRRYRQLDLDPSHAREVDWVSGAAVWLRREAFDDVGGWDEGYFMYVEDVDLCWRLRQAGWRVVYDPAGEVVHVQGTATARHPYRMLAAHHRSLLRFASRRWRGVRRVLLVPAAVFLGARALLTMAAHALRARSQRVPRGPIPSE